MENLERIDWEKYPLVPVIAQDTTSHEVLMHAWMNKEALELTLSTGYAHYYSRSRRRLWKKGESSGHVQEVVQALIDCDNDTILLKVRQTGVACHTGRPSCFFTDLKSGETTQEIAINPGSTYGVIDTLYHTLLERKQADPESSYTAKLYAKGDNAILKKVAEESGEFLLAVKDGNGDEIVYEAADLLYHALVALAHKDISPDRIRQELARRFGLSGLEEKARRPQ